MFRPDVRNGSQAQHRLKKWHSKVRTGCLTCRKRRVKCGEEQPCCARCSKAGLDCEYPTIKSGFVQYVYPTELASHPGAHIWPTDWTAPGTAEHLQFFIQECVPTLKLVSCPSSTAISAMSLFRDDHGRSLFGSFDPDGDAFGRYWCELAPQTAHRDPVMTKLIVLYATQLRSWLLSGAGPSRMAYYEGYNKALKTVTGAPVNAHSPTMTPVMACIIFSFQRLEPASVVSGEALSQASLLAQVIEKTSELPVVGEYLTPIQVFFRGAATELKSQALQAMGKQNTIFQNCTDKFRLPTTFESAKQAREWFFRICRARPSCLYGGGGGGDDDDDAVHWTPDCAAYIHVSCLLTTWSNRLAEYRQRKSTINNVRETRNVFQLKVQYLLIKFLLEVSAAPAPLTQGPGE